MKTVLDLLMMAQLLDLLGVLILAGVLDPFLVALLSMVALLKVIQTEVLILAEQLKFLISRSRMIKQD